MTLKLVTRAQWGARAPKYRNIGDLSAESTCHWNGPTVTVGGKAVWDHSKCAGLVRGIQNFHMDSRGWSDIAYNFVVCPHGYTFEGRGLNVINGANGTNSGNKTSHAVMCLAGPGNPFTNTEKVAFKDTIRHIDAKTNAPGTCKGHRDHKSTECPGDARYKWVHSGMPVSATGPSPTPPPPPWFGSWPYVSKPIIKEGARGDVVKYLQNTIYKKAGGAITVDGVFGPNTEKRVMDLQRYFGLSVDGIVGPKTWGIVDMLAKS